jgi:cell division inhibitor SepF
MPNMREGILDRILALMGLDVGLDPEEKMVERDVKATETIRAEFGDKVVSLRSSRNTRLMIVEPKGFSEVRRICDHLRRRRPVIVNVSGCDSVTSRRILDFVMGATYAMSGHMQKITDGVFLFTSDNFDIVEEKAADKE